MYARRNAKRLLTFVALTFLNATLFLSIFRLCIANRIPFGCVDFFSLLLLLFCVLLSPLENAPLKIHSLFVNTEYLIRQHRLFSAATEKWEWQNTQTRIRTHWHRHNDMFVWFDWYAHSPTHTDPHTLTLTTPSSVAAQLRYYNFYACFKTRGLFAVRVIRLRSKSSWVERFDVMEWPGRKWNSFVTMSILN